MLNKKKTEFNLILKNKILKSFWDFVFPCSWEIITSHTVVALQFLLFDSPHELWLSDSILKHYIHYSICGFFRLVIHIHFYKLNMKIRPKNMQRLFNIKFVKQKTIFSRERKYTD